MSEDQRSKLRCPYCGAGRNADAVKCWICQVDLSPQSGHAVTKSGEPTSPFKPPQFVEPVAQFRLHSMLLTITLVAIIFGVVRMHLGLGIVLIMLVTPAFIRTAIQAKRQRNVGQPLSPWDKLAAFGASLGIVLVTAIASGAAFYATCLGGFYVGAIASEAAGVQGYDNLGWGLLAGVSVGLLVGITVAAVLFKSIWSIRA